MAIWFRASGPSPARTGGSRLPPHSSPRRWPRPRAAPRPKPTVTSVQKQLGPTRAEELAAGREVRPRPGRPCRPRQAADDAAAARPRAPARPTARAHMRVRPGHPGAVRERLASARPAHCSTAAAAATTSTGSTRSTWCRRTTPQVVDSVTASARRRGRSRTPRRPAICSPRAGAARRAGQAEARPSRRRSQVPAPAGHAELRAAVRPTSGASEPVASSAHESRRLTSPRRPPARRQQAVRFALAQVGKPYVFGAAGPGSYDCSGLTMAAWARRRRSLPHSAADQYNYGTHVSRNQLAARRPGVLLPARSGTSRSTSATG